MITLFDKNKNRIPLKLWINSLADLEDSCLKQIENLSNLPFAFKHIAVMPDAHFGYGMPIGGILGAESSVIIPNAVGVDIGCGVLAVKTSLNTIDKETILKILRNIRELIPLGFNHHKKAQNLKLMPKLQTNQYYPIIEKEYNSALKQLGTLGGGNHFIEIQKSTNNNIWFMIHSGSRNLGKRVAQFHNSIAKKLDLKPSVPKNFDLAYLDLNSKEGERYFREMKFCLDFAHANRQLMARRIEEIFSFITKCSFQKEINIHHNYASIEKHFDKTLTIHRKGATRALFGEFGIIPGSQGTKSYIVTCLGNKESFMSCSHGAGRTLGRKQAIRELNFEQEKNKLESLGIIHSLRTQRDLDEASSAYKDIDMVIKNQSDLVEVVETLMPLAVIKG